METLIQACEWDKPFFLIFSQNVFGDLVYYSHLVPLILSLFLGIFILFQRPKASLNRLLFAMTLLFAVWVFFDLILWATDMPAQTMFFWPIINLVEPIIYVSSFYFLYVFANKKDLPFGGKISFFILLLPIVLLTPTRLALEGFDLTNCDREAIEGPLVYYGYFVEAISTLWILIYGVYASLRKPDRSDRIQILLVTAGLFLFLFSFAFGNIIGSLNVDWTLGQYGLFGLPVFVVFLAYLLVKYNALNTKVFSAQITSFLTVFLVTAVLFIRRIENIKVVLIPTIVILIVLSVILVRSVKREIKQKEQLEDITKELEVSNHNLGEANEKLKDLDKLKTEFLSLASHQLRSPLTAIKGYTSMLLEGSFGAVNPEQKEAIDRVFQSSTHLAKVVEDLLNVSKIEQGGLKYQMAVFDLEKAVKDLATDLSVTAEKKGLALAFETDGKPPYTINGDMEKLRQVILNIIDNAIKYTQTGSITVKLLHSGVGMVRIDVTDTGMGISAEEKSKLFQKFSRGEGGKLNTSGSGLGLYLAKQITEAHGGHIEIDSPGLGKGSTFSIELKQN